jgi:hypothetical protein
LGIMKAIRTDRESASSFQNVAEHLQGVLLYEDLETGTRAKEVCDLLLYQIESDSEIDLALWRFDMLRETELNACAASQAAEADVVVVSAHGRADLPSEVKQWLQLWLDFRKGNGHPVLIVSMDRERGEQTGEARILASLRTMVESAGVDLIPHYSELKNDLERSADRAWNPADPTKPLFADQSKPRPGSYEHWGLNE